MSEQLREDIEGWIILELFGKVTMAGFLSTETRFGTEWARLEVPEVDSIPRFTKFFNGSAIYAITPTDETTARLAARHLQVRPVSEWIVPMPPALMEGQSRQVGLPDDSYRYSLSECPECGIKQGEPHDEGCIFDGWPLVIETDFREECPNCGMTDGNHAIFCDWSG